MIRFRTSPPLVICLAILSIIILITIGLMLPWSTVDAGGQGFVNALFTAASATDVTGLCVVDTATHFTIVGQLIILAAIQLGGLGGVTIAIFPILFLGHNIPFSYKYSVKVERGFSTMGGELVDFVKTLFKTTFVCELIGTLLYSIRFIPLYGVVRGIYFSLFTSVSAFCNAGFSIFSDSLISFAQDPLVVWTTMALILTGGIGFSVLYPLIQRERLNEHAMMAIKFTLLLRLGGGVCIWLIERNNPLSIGGMSGLIQYQTAQFLSITPATAGFETVPTQHWSMITIFLLLVIMFIGACPGGTGGGVKVTTFGVIVMYAWQKACQNRKNVVFYHRKIPVNTLVNAVGVVVLYTISLVMAASVLLVTESQLFNNGFTFIDIVFEVFSAIGTVGLSRGITSQLSTTGRLIISLLMYLGRVGPATLAFSLMQNKKLKEDLLTYPEAEINVG